MLRRSLGLALLLTGSAAAQSPVPLLAVRRQAPDVTTSQQTGTVYTNGFDAPSAAGNNLGSYTAYGFAGLPTGVTGTYTATAPAGSPAGYGFGLFNDSYGGSQVAGGGQDNYVSTGGRVGSDGTHFLAATTTLTLSQTAFYLGVRWMAADSTNSIRLYKGAVPVDTISAQYVLSDDGLTNLGGYAGTDKRAADGSVSRVNAGEKYFYLNIYAKDASQGFDRVEFDNSTNGSGFESDNHTVGFDLIDANFQAGVVLVPVPEPAGLVVVAGVVVAVRARRAKRRRAV